MNKRAQAYSDDYSAKNSNADASLDRSPSPTTARSGSQTAPLNEAEIRARLDQFAKELAQAQRDRASHWEAFLAIHVNYSAASAKLLRAAYV